MEYLSGVAWADYCSFTYNGKKYDVTYDDDACQPYPFGYFRNPDTNTFEFRIGGLGMTHEDLRYRPKYANDNYNAETEEKNIGRVYLRDKLIVFWQEGLPDKTMVRRVLADLSKAFDEDLWITVSFNDFLLCGEMVDEQIFVVPISEYLGYGNAMADFQKRQRSQLAMDKRLGQQKLADWEVSDPHADKMYRNVVEESVEMQGYASPDCVNCYNDEMGWHFRGSYDGADGEPLPFGYLHGQMWIGEVGWRHNTMVYCANHPDEMDDWDGDEYSLEYDSDGKERKSYGDGYNELEYQGRIWLDGGFLCFWDWDQLNMNRHKMAKIIKDLEDAIYDTWCEEINLYDFVLLYPSEKNTLLGCVLKNYISGRDDNTDMNRVAANNKAKSDTVLSTAHGKQDLAQWYAESPYADRMYKNVMEKIQYNRKQRKRLTEKEIRRIVKQCLLESYDSIL